MSLSCSDCFSDLLCGEDSNIIFAGGIDDLPEYSSDIESSPPDVEESIAGLVEDERDLAGINSPLSHRSIDASTRAESVAWILKVQRYYCFQPLTAYLSVNYFDRFLHSHHLPKMNGWPLQLLSVACLSLAAKMEEPLVPSLLDLQVESAKFMFEPKNIQRMELLVLRVLDWRLRSISPFCYLSFFAVKIDPSATYTAFLASRAKEIILSTIQEGSFLEYRPSCIAAAAMLYAANDLPRFSMISAQHAESWTGGLNKVRKKRRKKLIVIVCIFSYGFQKLQFFAGKHHELLPIDTENGSKEEAEEATEGSTAAPSDESDETIRVGVVGVVVVATVTLQEEEIK